MKFTMKACQKKGVPAFVLLLLTSSSAWAAYGLPYSFVEKGITQTGHIQKVYNQDEFEGNWKQLKGAIKENWGEFTEDDLLAIEGRTDRFEGKLQERYGERKEEVKEWVDKWLENHPYDAHDRKR